MNKLIPVLKNIILFIIFVLIAESSSAQQNIYKLTVIVDHIEKIRGKLEISLYNNAKTFPKDNVEYMTRSVPVRSDTVKCVFYVPPGIYAIALYHDANNNNKCDENLLGIPEEGFGFSNNVKPFMRAPSFDACKFQVSKDTVIRISLLTGVRYRHNAGTE